MSLETPLHKVQGLGSSHSGVKHFWRQRVSAALLIPLSIWFGISMLGLVGANLPSVDMFLQQPMNAILMGAFVLTALYHLALGLQEVVLDYIPQPGLKLFLMTLNTLFGLAVAAASVFALLRIAVAS